MQGLLDFNMTAIARNHHYLPRAYLKAFTHSGKRDGRTHVLDTKNSRAFAANIENVAVERDFNHLESDEFPSDFVETALGDMERRAGEVMLNMCQNSRLAEPKDLCYVMNLMALIFVRNPRGRRMIESMRSRVLTGIAKLLVSDKAVYDQTARARCKEERLEPQGVNFEAVKRLVDSGEYKITFNRGAHIRTELRVFDDVLKLIGGRCWSIFVAASDAPDFVTCDHPVLVVPKNPENRSPIGAGSRQTEMFFPIGPRHALRGVFEDPYSEIVSVKPFGVAMWNTEVFLNADRWIYSKGSVLHRLSRNKIVSVNLKT
jgi:Protein of unknown function (DUF4238)